MKILHIIYTTGVSGAENHLLDLLPELQKFDIDCELLCICPQKNFKSLQQYCRQMNEKGIKATLLTTRSRMAFLFTAKRIARYLKSNYIHIVHSHLFNGDLIAVLVKKFYFKKLVILSTKHGYEEKYLIQYGQGNKKISYNLYYFIARSVIKKIDHNLAVSRAISEMYAVLKLGKNKMKYIDHGINTELFQQEQAQIEGDPKILMVGRLSEMKGHTYLIQALPEIIQKFPNLKLIVLGNGPLKVELLKQASGLHVLRHIEFVGFAKPNKYISQCQLMILPSLFEPFGLVYIESFALKIPVITFDVEAGNQIIEDNETGFLVPYKNSKALAGKIIYLLQSPDERKRIIKNAYNKYLTYYNVGRMAKETTEWYHSILMTGKE
ncbi:MAG: glycosyltransferase family 4 protein [Ginsengibacter sp.]